jgi:hypothetical protein
LREKFNGNRQAKYLIQKIIDSKYNQLTKENPWRLYSGFFQQFGCLVAKNNPAFHENISSQGDP